VQLARRLSASVRDSDTVARLGGDEFVILLGRLSAPAGAGLVAARILATFAAPFELPGEHPRLRASIGISLFPGNGDDADTLLRKADAAMYRAKSGGQPIHFAASEPDVTPAPAAAPTELERR
jgi:diguanylate cyclase (GGDEF)-like protein